MGNCCAGCTVGGAGARERAFNRALHLNDTLVQQLKGVGLAHQHLFALHQIFSAMDKDKSGEINMLEFFDYVDLKRSRFSEKAFAVMDRDGSGEVDFIEFVLAVWNYCSFSHASLVRFAFDLYDVDGSGEIEPDEAARCVREVWGGAWETSASAQKILAKLEHIMASTAHNRLSAKLFQDFAVRHPMLLFPAFELQMDIQHKILGERFWSRAARKRGSLCPADMNWEHVKEITLVSRQSSSNLLTAMEEDLGEQLQAKRKGSTTSNGQRRLSGFPRFPGKRSSVVNVSDHESSEAQATSATSGPTKATVAARAPQKATLEPSAPRRTGGTAAKSRRASADTFESDQGMRTSADAVRRKSAVPATGDGAAGGRTKTAARRKQGAQSVQRDALVVEDIEQQQSS